MEDTNQTLSAFEQLGGSITERRIATIQPGMRLITVTQQSVERSEYSDQQGTELAFLAIGLKLVVTSDEARRGRRADAQDFGQLRLLDIQQARCSGHRLRQRVRCLCRFVNDLLSSALESTNGKADSAADATDYRQLLTSWPAYRVSRSMRTTPCRGTRVVSAIVPLVSRDRPRIGSDAICEARISC